MYYRVFNYDQTLIIFRLLTIIVLYIEVVDHHLHIRMPDGTAISTFKLKMLKKMFF